MNRRPATERPSHRDTARRGAFACLEATDPRRGNPELARLLQNHAASIVNSSADAIFAQTIDGIIVSWNVAAERTYGYLAREIIGESVSALFPAEMHEEIAFLNQQLKSGFRIDSFEAAGLTRSGARINISFSISPIVDELGRVLGASAIARDVGEQSRTNESIRYLATHDVLTDLANYLSLQQAFETEMRRSNRTERPFAVLLIDVDRLKEINDTHGHLVGTRALCRLAGILKKTCRSIDTAARYGGDEFAVLLVETHEESARYVAQRITDMLAMDDESPALTVSIGVAVYPRDERTVESLLAAADRSLYKNKLHKVIRDRICEEQTHGKDAEMAGTGADRRRSERLLLDVALVVRGETNERVPFQEETFTISVSAHGTMLVMATKVELGQKLLVKNLQTQDETEGRVVRFGSPYGGLAQVGIEFTQPAPRFWPIDTLPDSWKFAQA